MRIQHNIMAMNAYRSLGVNQSGLAKNLEKLSSGYRIIRAGDDAGLAISEKVRAQITGLDAAQKNVKDGISLVKTAEGAMQEVHDMLNRMKYPVTRSANGTYDNEVARANLRKEVDSLKSEINRIADSANFNGQNLIDGSLDADTDLTEHSTIDLPKTGELLGVETILYTNAKEAGKTSFEVNLHDISYRPENDKMTLTLSDGNKTEELTITTTADMDSEDIAASSMKAFTDGQRTILGQDFTANDDALVPTHGTLNASGLDADLLKSVADNMRVLSATTDT